MLLIWKARWQQRRRGLKSLLITEHLTRSSSDLSISPQARFLDHSPCENIMADNDVQLDISDFDSSDLDLDTDEETFFVAPENAGKRNVDAIFANQKQNRLDSKKAVRNLEFGSGAPKTFYMQNATKNMFNAFLKTLNHE